MSGRLLSVWDFAQAWREVVSGEGGWRWETQKWSTAVQRGSFSWLAQGVFVLGSMIMESVACLTYLGDCGTVFMLKLPMCMWESGPEVASPPHVFVWGRGGNLVVAVT